MMSQGQLNLLIGLLAAVTLFELMVSIGLRVKFAEILDVAGNWRLVARAVVASYICVPAAVVGLLLLFNPYSLDPEQFPMVAAGFLIVAVCPGAPYGPPCTGLARGNVTVSVGLMIILSGSSAIVAPLLLRLLTPLTSGSHRVQIDAVKMVETLLLLQLLPLCIGLALRKGRPALAERLEKPARILSLILNVLTLGIILIVQFQMLLGIPLRAYVGMLALIVASVAAGWLLGEPGAANRKAMVMATSVRNVGVGLVIAAASFPGTKAVTAVTVFALVQTIVMGFIAFCWGRFITPSPFQTEEKKTLLQDTKKVLASVHELPLEAGHR
jgi:BASS family bile acid:Na+ symporter